MAEDNSNITDLPADDDVAGVKYNSNPAPPPGPYVPKKAEPTTAPPLNKAIKPKTNTKLSRQIKVSDNTTDTISEVPVETRAPTNLTLPPISATEPSLAVDESSDEPILKTDDNLTTSPLNDRDTDLAVDDIAEKEGDTLLALEDAQADKRSRIALGANKSGWKNRLKTIFKSKWTWLTVLVIVVALFGVPLTRYKLLGLVIKRTVNVSVIDSRTGTPVSSAAVRLGSTTVKTDGEGRVSLKVGVGKRNLVISKKYYTSLSSSTDVSFSPIQSIKKQLVATGRLVPVTVTNEITGQPIKEALIKIRSTTAKTNARGQASIALPADASHDPANVSASGYNPSSVNVQATNQVVAGNSLQIVPSGKLYFLSNASATIDVVETNLDGSDRRVILAGTGNESAASTSLLASSDWRYLVLEANRGGSNGPALYLINTSTDKLTEFEDSGADITLIGWSGHDFIYDLNKPSEPYWQSGREVVKSYDADSMQTNQLDENQAEGTANAYAYQSFGNFYIVNGSLVYSTEWNTFDASGNYDTSGKANTIRAVGPTGLNKKDYQSLPLDTTGYIQSVETAPGVVYFALSNDSGGSITYYEYQNQSVTQAAINSATFSNSYPTYLTSPSGNETLWEKVVDGQNGLFVGNAEAANQNEVVSSGSYMPYGWYSDNYIMLTKAGSELYIMPAAGLAKSGQILKIADYYQPSRSALNYGGY
jgi:hypothetical protein